MLLLNRGCITMPVVIFTVSLFPFECLCLRDCSHCCLTHASCRRCSIFSSRLRLSVMRKKVAHLARSAMGGNDVPNPEEGRVQLKWVRQQITVADGFRRTRSFIANPHKADLVQSTSRSRVNLDEILPRKTRKSSHCGRVASSLQGW
jgi:hypothetical protein